MSSKIRCYVEDDVGRRSACFRQLSLCLAPAYGLQAAEAFYKFEPGTTWTYQSKAGNKCNFQVVKQIEGKVQFEERWYDSDGHEVDKGKAEVTWSVDNGYLSRTWGKGANRTTLRVYKMNSSKGDTWGNPLPTPAEMNVTNHGPEEVSVPAGTYIRALRIGFRISGAGQDLMEYWLAPGVGLVRFRWLEGEDPGKPIIMRLTRFKEGE